MKVTITIADDQYEELKDCARQAGLDMKEFTRHAMRTLKALLDERGRGKSIYIGQNDKVEKELLLLS